VSCVTPRGEVHPIFLCRWAGGASEMHSMRHAFMSGSVLTNYSTKIRTRKYFSPLAFETALEAGGRIQPGASSLGCPAVPLLHLYECLVALTRKCTLNSNGGADGCSWITSEVCGESLSIPPSPRDHSRAPQGSGRIPGGGRWRPAGRPGAQRPGRRRAWGEGVWTFKLKR